MTRDPILIRVDGTSRTGHERLARCLILAAALHYAVIAFAVLPRG